MTVNRYASMTQRDHELLLEFLALPRTAMASAEWCDRADAEMGDAMSWIVSDDKPPVPAYVLLRADYDGWRDGVTVLLSSNN